MTSNCFKLSSLNFKFSVLTNESPCYDKLVWNPELGEYYDSIAVLMQTSLSWIGLLGSFHIILSVPPAQF